MRHGLAYSLMSLLLVLGLAAPAAADTMYWSNNASFSTFENGDIMVWDTDTSTNSLAIAEDDLFRDNEAIDALSMTSTGNWIISTTGSATIDGTNQSLSFQDEDLVEYNPITGEVFLFEDMSAVFNQNEDLDAVHLMDDGTILLSTTNGATIDGSNQSLSFDDEDIVRWDPMTGEVFMFVDMTNVFDSGADVSAIQLHDSGTLYFSTYNDESIDGLNFRNDHVVALDLATLSVGYLYTTVVGLPGLQGIRSFHIVAEPGLPLVLATFFALTALSVRQRPARLL